MRLIVCVDDRGGMLFNGRRLSSDRVVTERIKTLCGGGRLLVTPYSCRLFPRTDNVFCCIRPLQEASGEDTCFVEDRDVRPALAQAAEVVLFHWNRAYPADLHFPMDALCGPWQLTHREEFPGHSHERITMEVYRK